MLNHIVQVVFLSDADGGEDVIRAVGVHPAAHLTADDRHQRLHLVVRLGSFGRVGFGFEQGVGIIFCVKERFAQKTGQSHAGLRGLLACAVVSFWIFAEGKLHLLAARDCHFLCGVTAQLDGNAGTADDVARAGCGVYRCKARLTDRNDRIIVGVNSIHCADVRLNRTGHLVAVGKSRQGIGFAEVADMGMTVDQTRGDPAAGSVDDFGAFRQLDVRTDSFDLAVVDKDGRLVKGLTGDGEHFAVDDCFHGCADSSFLCRRNLRL